MTADPREPYGRIVHDTRLAREAARAEAEGRQRFNLGDWEDRDEHQRELDMAIGAAVAAAAVAAERERIRQLAIRSHAVCADEEGGSFYFAALIGEPQERSDEEGATP